MISLLSPDMLSISLSLSHPLLSRKKHFPRSLITRSEEPMRVSGWNHVRASQSSVTVGGIQKQIPFLLRMFSLLVHLHSAVPLGPEYIFLSFWFSPPLV